MLDLAGNGLSEIIEARSMGPGTGTGGYQIFTVGDSCHLPTAFLEWGLTVLGEGQKLLGFLLRGYSLVQTSPPVGRLRAHPYSVRMGICNLVAM